MGVYRVLVLQQVHRILKQATENIFNIDAKPENFTYTKAAK
jgi:hypothetical protein